VREEGAIHRRRPGGTARYCVLCARQLIQADIDRITPDDPRHHPLGSSLNGGKFSPRGDELAPPGEWLAFADWF
jgi:hypothetical protein